ncbi:MAG: HAMP domain-containing histidine kinase [Eubacterium sp.]|nr:HAMP domain-containing histidine kinase [Eubacterium sp.]
MNIGFGMMLLLTIFPFLYINYKIVRPFAAMEKMTEDLAKGHLTTPLKEEKSRVFGRFLWGLDMLREQLEESRERERAYQKERKTLMLSLSHDIKTPLSAIELYEKALSTGLYDTPEKQEAAYAGIHKNAEELHRYIDEITAASREDFLALTINMDEYYLEDVISEIRDYYKEKFTTLHTEFHIGERSNPLLRGDANRLTEVLQNLLENAIKYGDGREVRVWFSEEEDAQLIHVNNSGIAPPEEEMVHLFDSFYRGSNVGEKPGSGLGLYISRELMRRMDGELYATAEGGFTAVAVVRKA